MSCESNPELRSSVYWTGSEKEIGASRVVERNIVNFHTGLEEYSLCASTWYKKDEQHQKNSILLIG